MKQSKLIPIAATIAAAIGFSGNALADSYAVAYQNVTNLLVNSDPFVPLSAFRSFSSTSTATASLNLSGVTSGGTTPAGSGGPINAPAVNAPASTSIRVDEAYNLIGPTAGDYSNADAAVVQTVLAESGVGNVVLTGDTYTQARNIAESNVVGTSTADASGSNSSNTGFEFGVVLTEATSFSFTFDNDPFMEVALSADAGLGSLASANITMSIVITNNDTGAEVFSWSPDGAAGGITGGTEVLDPFNLNDGPSLSDNNPGTVTVDPTGDRSTAALNPAPVLSYSAFTDLIAPGDYNIEIEMSETTEVRSSNVERVPEPSTIALLGMGLLTGFVARRRRKNI